MPLKYYRRYPLGKTKNEILRKKARKKVSILSLVIVCYHFYYVKKKFRDTLKDAFDISNTKKSYYVRKPPESLSNLHTSTFLSKITSQSPIQVVSDHVCD